MLGVNKPKNLVRYFFFQAEDGIRDDLVTGVQTCALPICVTGLDAERGESVLRQLIGTDAGAGRLGEVALVPHGSPISQSGLLFYNTLFDENAASHVALGSAYKFTLSGGDAMDDEQV